ncbi:hypothetical protein FB45DRAFT_936420 [Roridomyces roridus]|uniref:MYND-type domain-containing protein n=1 Tax=Roridomyces roridus TaxID=1738132 RepID=A0AAD7FC14_9AGAR|nr:hypothetical protein FB45DRAFT_936420 [Roridomyces roridus]
MLNQSDHGVTEYSQLLGLTIPPLLVSYSVIVEMKASFARVEQLAQQVGLSQSLLNPCWGSLKTMVRDRSQLVEGWEASKRTWPPVRCDNLECDQVTLNDAFRRCAGCSTIVYCSRECQRADWIAGHREECHVLLPVHREVITELGMSHRESDYYHFRFQICMDIVRLMLQTTSDTPFFVAFDYTRPTGVNVSVLTLDRMGPAEAVPHLGRLARGRGRLMLHWIRFGTGSSGCTAPFPLRLTSSQLGAILKGRRKFWYGT